MRPETLSLLRCPAAGCAGELRVKVDAESGGRIHQGRLLCARCGECYPVQDSIARLLPPALRAETATASTIEAERDSRLPHSGAPLSAEAAEGSVSVEADRTETAHKRREMAARDAQVESYDRMRGLAWFGKIEIPVTLAQMNLGQTDVLLEAGCGTGRMTPVFSARCRAQVALDFSWESLQVCRRKLEAQGRANVDLIQADVCALPFHDDAFTRVVSCQVLEHVPTPDSRARMVAELARVAQPGGAVVISAYQHSLFTRLFDRKEGEHTGGIYYYRFTRGELRALLARFLEVQGLTGALVYHYLARCRKR